MASLRITILLLAFGLLGCQESVEIEQRKWAGPVDGTPQMMDQLLLSPWTIVTYSENRGPFILLKKENGPTFSYDSSGKNHTVMVHPPNESGHSSIDVTDSNGDGVFDRIRFFSGPEADTFTMYEANLVNGVWGINEH